MIVEYDRKKQQPKVRTVGVTVTLSSIEPIASGNILGRVSSGTGAVELLSDTQIKTLLDIIGVTTSALNAKAALASPALTGTPTTPTATAGTNTTQVANTAFVQGEIAALVNSSPAALDTLNELATALGDDPNFAATMTTALAGKQATLTTGTGITIASNVVSLTDSGVTAGSYGSTTELYSFTIDAKGRITATGSPITIAPTFASIASKPTTLSGYGISDGQVTLVSGTNIKTINGSSILGSGNLTVTGGGTSYSSALITMSWTRQDATTLTRNGVISTKFSDISGLSVAGGLGNTITLPTGKYKIRLDNWLINAGRLNSIIRLSNAAGSALDSGGIITNLVSCSRISPNSLTSTGTSSSTADCYQGQIFYLELSGNATFYIASTGTGFSDRVIGASFAATPGIGSYMDTAIEITKIG